MFLPTSATTWRTTAKTTAAAITTDNTTATIVLQSQNQNCEDEDSDETNRIDNLFIDNNRQLFETIKLSEKDY